MVKPISNDMIDCRHSLQDTGNLRRSIAIICFNDTRIAFYRDLMGDITSGMVTEYHRVSRKADVTQIKSMVSNRENLKGMISHSHF